MLDGTGSDVVTVPNDLRIENDSNFWLALVASNPAIAFDADDYTEYNRAGNYWRWLIGAAEKLRLASTGKLTGAGFYDSGEVTVTSGSTQGFTHGLGAQPRFLAVYFGSAGSTTNVATPAFLSVGATVRYGANDSTTISVTNNHGSSWVVRVYAML